MDVMGARRMAVLVDPDGAFVRLWQSGDHRSSGTRFSIIALAGEPD